MHLRDLAASLSQSAVVAFKSTSFCYVDGLTRPTDSFVTDPVNLGNPIEMSVSDFADVVADLVGDSGRVYAGLPVGDSVRRQPDISVARSVLEWEPIVPFVDGLQRTSAYLRDVRS